MQAPFPWFGGKSRAADEIWTRLGNVPNYVEPFAGSLAVLLARPHEAKTETVNDLDKYLANFWRAVKSAPDAVAEHADWPVNEADLEARHYWLVTTGRQRLETAMADPEGYDAKVAGWWLWGICSWIGSGWCSGEGPWRFDGERWRKLPHLGDAGQGINRQLPHLGDAGQGIAGTMHALADRLRTVRVCCGDWRRVTGDSVTLKHGLTGVLLDPPYSAEDRADTYNHDSRSVAHEARAWAIEAGKNPLMRVAFCGYAGEFADPWPDGWKEWAWKTKGGYASQSTTHDNPNAKRERVWFSPHCLAPTQPGLFEEVRYLAHGAEADADEVVQPLGGHHSHHARLAIKQ